MIFNFFFNFVFYFKNNKNDEINKKIAFLLYLPYSSVVLGDLRKIVGLLGGRIHLLGGRWLLLARSRVAKKVYAQCFMFL